MKKLGILFTFFAFLSVNPLSLSADCQIVTGNTNLYGAKEKQIFIECCGSLEWVNGCEITNNSADCCTADSCQPSNEQ